MIVIVKFDLNEILTELSEVIQAKWNVQNDRDLKIAWLCKKLVKVNTHPVNHRLDFWVSVERLAELERLVPHLETTLFYMVRLPHCLYGLESTLDIDFNDMVLTYEINDPEWIERHTV